ncbi:hypothetical protein Landi51_01477 [Colletotrichum acutatum]
MGSLGPPACTWKLQVAAKTARTFPSPRKEKEHESRKRTTTGAHDTDPSNGFQWKEVPRTSPRTQKPNGRTPVFTPAAQSLERESEGKCQVQVQLRNRNATANCRF